MNYKYSYEDWLEGKFSYNQLNYDILGSIYVMDKTDYNNLISEDCHQKIRDKQFSILDKESKKYLKQLMKRYVIKSRDSFDFERHSKALLETIVDLLSNPTLQSKEYLDMNFKTIRPRAVKESNQKKVYLNIGPLGFCEVETCEIKFVQEAFNSFVRNKKSWNHEVVGYPDISNRSDETKFSAVKKAKALYEFCKKIKKRPNSYSNTFAFNLSRYEMRILRSELIRSELISDVEPRVFNTITNGKFNLGIHKINWIASKDALYYFIQQMGSKLVFKNSFLSKWEMVANTFTIKGKSIDPVSLSKSNIRKLGRKTRSCIDKLT